MESANENPLGAENTEGASSFAVMAEPQPENSSGAEHNATPIPFADRHPWIVDLDERDRSLLATDTGDRTAWARALHFITNEEFLAAVNDPELKGIYLPPMTAAQEAALAAYKGLPGVGPYDRAFEVRHLLRLKAMEEAKDYARGVILAEPALAEMNADYAVIRNLGGKCRVVTLDEDPMLKRLVLSKQSFEDFRNAYCNRFVEVFVGPDKDGKPKFKQVPLGKYWLEHPFRREFERVVFAPGLDVPKEDLNLWRGFACNPARGGTLHLSFLGLLEDIICNGDEVKLNYLLDWMARAVQIPHQPGLTAVVLRSTEEGTGKSFFGKMFGRLFGGHYISVSNSKHVIGNFNSHLRTCIVLMAEEAFFAGDRAGANALKSLLTDATIPVEGKGLDVEHSANCLHVIMTSNEEHVLRAGEFARRFFVCTVRPWESSDEAKAAYFDSIEADLLAGGLKDLLGFLLDRDISKFDPLRDLPHTAELQQQKDLTDDDPWVDVIEAQLPEGDCKVRSDDLFKVLALTPDRMGQRDKERLGSAMRKHGFEHKNARFGGKVCKGYVRGVNPVELKAEMRLGSDGRSGFALVSVAPLPA